MEPGGQGGSENVRRIGVVAEAPIDRGRGYLPSAWTAAITGVILLMNLTALFLSVPIVVRDAPVEYVSDIEGEMSLPFLPHEPSEVEVVVPDTVFTREPFDVVVHFERPPCLRVYTVFRSGGHEREFRMIRVVETTAGIEYISVIPGLPEAGNWTVGLTFHRTHGKSPVPPVFELVDITDIVVHDRAGTYLVPSFGRDLTFSGGPEFNIIGDEVPGNVSLTVDDLPPVPLHFDEGVFTVKEGVLIKGGWNRAVVNYSLRGERTGSSFIFFEQYGVSQGMAGPPVAVSRCFDGKDRLYGQEHQGWVPVSNGIELYGGELYEVSIPLPDVEGLWPAGHFSNSQGRLTIDLTLRVDGSGYPLFLGVKDDGYRTIVRIPDDRANCSISLNLDQGQNDTMVREFNVDLRVDHLPEVVMTPDPYIAFRGGGYLLEVSTGRKMDSSPEVQIGGYVTPMNRTGDGLSTAWETRLDERLVLSGEVLNITASTTYRYETSILLLLPMYPFAFAFPPTFTGWGLVAWFIITSVLIVVSSVALAIGVLPWKKRTSWTGGRSWKERFLPQLETSKVFIGALFFSISVTYLFGILEQPTPVPAILSGDVPVWIRMINLAEASVWEEFAGRVLLIGVPLMFIHFGKQGGSWRYLLGGHGRFGKAEVILVLFSSLLFGFAHLGWGPWKVVPTFVTGLLFGYLYVKVGLHATVVMHFLFDYIGFFGELTGWGNWSIFLLFLTALVLGPLYLGWLVHSSTSPFRSRLSGPLSKAPLFLIAHSSLVLITAFLIFSGGPHPVGFLYLAVPPTELIAYLLWRRGKMGLSDGIIYVSSLPTLPLAPLSNSFMFRRR